MRGTKWRSNLKIKLRLLRYARNEKSFTSLLIMYNLYQSQLRKDIQQVIYRKPTFTMELFGKEYFWTIKTKKIWPFTTKRYQIMGVELPVDKKYVYSELLKLKKHFKGKGIFFQLGLVNEIISFENVSHRSEEFKEDMMQMRLNLQEFLCSNYGFEVAFRENMPNSDIIIDVSKPDEQLLNEMNSWSRQRIKKALSKEIKFWMASPDQYELFYKKRVETSGDKWFNVIPYEQFERLIRYITQNSCGNLFVTSIDQELVSGSICFYDGKYIIYMYGFTNRKFGNVWSHHYLKYKMFSRARENGFVYCDLMGGAPTGFAKHPLASVSAFKESLGGIKVEQYGSFDIVLNKFLYRIFKLYYRFKG